MSNGEVNPLKRARSEEQDHAALPEEFLEPSFFGIAPYDDKTQQIGQFIWHHAQNLDHVEVEAKIGVLLGRMDGPPMRLELPVLTETILSSSTDSICRFESNMSREQHAAYNRLLNSRVEEQSQKGYSGARIDYKHLYELDHFHPLPSSHGLANDGYGRIRVTFTLSKDRKQKSLKENGCIIKTRVADLNVFWPSQPFDFRISVNTETPASYPDGAPESARMKDRVSYAHQIVQVDLTKVEPENLKRSNNASADGSIHQRSPAPPKHEIEVEFVNMQELLEEGRKAFAEEPKPNVYFEMIAVFLNTVRMLIKNAN